MAHDPDVYRKLLFELREAHAEHGGAAFGLNAYTLEEERALPSEIVEQGLMEWTGGVYLPPEGSGVAFRVWACLGPPVAPPALWKKVCLRARNAWRAFKPLARRAGAHLPANVRSVIPVEPGTAESYWYSVLWWLQQPGPEDIWPKEAYGRFVSTDPILDSIEAIEACGLAGPEPRFPVQVNWEYDGATGKLSLMYSDSVGKGEPAAPKPRGRPKADYARQQHEAEIADQWEQARDAGTYKGDFAKDHSMSVADLDALLSRVRKRQSRAD